MDASCNEPVPELALWGTEIGLWDWDVVNDRLTWINDWCEHSQLSAFSGSGHESLWQARIHPEDLQAYRDVLNAQLTGHAMPYDVEYRLRNREDDWVWIHESGRVIERDSNGRALRVVGLCLDVNERRNTARALARSESRFAHAVWGTSVGLWDHDRSLYDRHTLRIGGTIGAPASIWIPAAVPATRIGGMGVFIRMISPLSPAGTGHGAGIEGRSTIYETEYRLRTRSGNWRWIMSRGRATARDDTGRAIGVAGVTIDIDARKRMELALRDSEARLEAAIWGADLGLWDWKLEDDSLLWLSDWPTRFGIDAAVRTIRRDEWVDRVHPLDRRKYAAEDHALIYDGSNAAESDYRIQSSSGEWRWVNVRTRGGGTQRRRLLGGA